MARVIDTLQLASKLAHPALGRSDGGAAASGPTPPGRDYYERSLALDMQANWEEVFQTLRTIVRPADVASISQEELGKHIDYFEYDLSRNYFEGKLFIGQDGDRLTDSPAEYMAWLKAKVTPETGPGVTMPIDQMGEAFAKLQTDEERTEFLKRNGLDQGKAMILFENALPGDDRAAADPAPIQTEPGPTQAPAIRAYKAVDRSADEWRTMLELIRSLEPADWTGSSFQKAAVA